MKSLQLRHQISQQLSRISISVKRNWSDGLLVTPGLHGLHPIQRDHADRLPRIQAHAVREAEVSGIQPSSNNLDLWKFGANLQGTISSKSEREMRLSCNS